jgi:hypothetical protein
MDTPTADEVRGSLAGLDVRQKKIVGGMLAVMIKNSHRVRDREWITEQLAHLTLLAGEFEAGSTQEGLESVRDYLRENVGVLLNACYLLFQRVGLDLEPTAATGFSFEEALGQALGYLGSAEADSG